MLGELGIKGAIVDLVQAGLAAGITDPNSAAVDMSGFLGCLFIGIIGVQDAAATARLDVEESDDQTTWFPLANAFISAPANSDDKLIVLDVQRPKRRYLRTHLIRGPGALDNTTWGGTIAIRYLGRSTPVPVGLGHATGSPIQTVTDVDV